MKLDASAQTTPAAPSADKQAVTVQDKPADTPSTGLRAPDLYTLSVGVGEGGFAQFSLTVDRNTGVYVSAGFGVGVAGPLPVSASLMGGYLTQSSKPNETTLVSTIGGRSTSIGGGFIGGGDVNLKPTGPKIVSGGLTSPQAGAVISNAKYLGNLNNGMKSFIDFTRTEIKNDYMFIQRAMRSLPMALSPDANQFNYGN